MEERFLYHIWDEGHLLHSLKTVCGKDLRIVYQGQFNTGRGPDFKNATIELDGEQLRGDIEIHVKTRDWQAHNHHEDIHYNKVILHVVLTHNSTYDLTIREDGGAAPVLELENQLSDDIKKLVTEHDYDAKPAVYCELLSAIDKDHLELILLRAGINRFEGKTKRFNTALSLSSFDQIFYEGIFEALGYTKNKLNTLFIAQNLPLLQLREFKEAGMTQDELFSIYLGSSGLLYRKGEIMPAEDRERAQKIYEAQTWYAKKLDLDWQLFRIRPQSHPLIRLQHISPLIYHCLDEGLFKTFLRFTSSYDQLLKGYRAIWKEGSLSPDLAQIRLGKSVQDNIYINIFLPILALWYRKMGEKDSPAIEAYKSFSALQDNYITRFMHRYLSDSHVKLANSKAVYQQGLIDIYHRFCSWHLCKQCMEGNSLGSSI